jgi:fibronectin type III domain protein/VWA domain-containing protein
MHVPGPAAWVVRAVVVAALLGTILPVAPALGATAPAGNDPSDIVLVLDFSGSILEDKAVRTAFADAIDGIAARVDETADTLTAGDATVSIVRFATKAADLADCTGLRLRQNKEAVADLSACLRRVAAAYRKGVDPALTRALGDDTNYVAAMERAATHVPAAAKRPAIIFFTDGRHEASGVPVSAVIPARDRLFADRTPFALLPVGMGVDPDDRPRLEAGLAGLRITRDFERCEGGPLEWPAVVFDSAEAAGQAVALALQNVSCTFTVEPTPTPPPTPTPEPPAPVGGIRTTAGDASLVLVWNPPADAESSPIEDYRARCRPRDGGDWVESSEGVSTEPSTTLSGLINGVEYSCEVSAVRSGGGPEIWTAAPLTATPVGRPPAPAKPAAQPLDTGVRLDTTMPAGARVTGYDFECSADGGATWTIQRQVGAEQASAEIGGLTNGTAYVCRASATNESGQGDFSALSDAFRPCSGVLDCNPILLIPIGGLVLLVAAWLLFTLIRRRAGRAVYVTAQVDQFTPVSLGRGPKVGMAFVMRGPSDRVSGIVPAEGRKANLRIRYTGGVTFQVDGDGRRRKTEFGRVVQVFDPDGRMHELVLRAFDQPPQDRRQRTSDEIAPEADRRRG